MIRNKSQESWEKRSQILGDSREAVMEQSFPPVINAYIERRIHTQEIISKVKNKKLKCLDVGCGYGRIASLVVKKNPNLFVDGIDISKTFVAMYNKKLKGKGKAVVGDVKKLPYKKNTFDFIWVVGTLMYLETLKDQEAGMKELFRVLKKGGEILIIEPNKPGHNLLKLWGFIPFVYRTVLRKRKVETYGIYFPWNRIDSLISNQKGILLEKKGYPFFSFCLLPMIGIGKINSKWTSKALGIVSKLDKNATFPKYSWFVTYIARKP